MSAIVNGRDALNSIVGSNNNSVTAEDVVATDKTYKDCYFVVAADLGTGDAPIAFVPIGKDSTHYFAGTIYGGNDSDANNRTMRTINLNIQQSDVSNVGLFGYVKGATISHLTTAGTIVGGAAVGGLVGYADGVTISNCRNNATVTGAYMIGGLVGFGNNVTITSSVNNADITGEYNKAGTPSGLTKGAYVGGFVGVVNGGSIANCYNNGNISASGDNSDFLGGVVGYANGTNIKNATNNASVEGDTKVGGIVGYADSTSRMYGTIVNSGNITANSMVGGVSGENHGFWCDTNSNYGTFKNSGSINGRNGATVGGVTAFADKEMCNAENTGNVIGGNAVGGVAGRVQAPIKNSYNSGEIVGTNPTAQGEISGTPTGVFVGGITGYTTVNGTISNCYNKGHIAAHSASGDYINNGDYVGGIVGFAQAKVEYCANIGGLIEGNNFIGGIVGSALDNTNIDYCYDVQGQRKFRWDGCNHGSITGSGGNVTNSWAINEKQVQTTANNPNPVVSTKGYRLTTAFAVTPQVDLQNTTNQKWEDILSSKINGFKVVGSVAKTSSSVRITVLILIQSM